MKREEKLILFNTNIFPQIILLLFHYSTKIKLNVRQTNYMFC